MSRHYLLGNQAEHLLYLTFLMCIDNTVSGFLKVNGKGKD